MSNRKDQKRYVSELRERVLRAGRGANLAGFALFLLLLVPGLLSLGLGAQSVAGAATVKRQDIIDVLKPLVGTFLIGGALVGAAAAQASAGLYRSQAIQDLSSEFEALPARSRFELCQSLKRSRSGQVRAIASVLGEFGRRSSATEVVPVPAVSGRGFECTAARPSNPRVISDD